MTFEALAHLAADGLMPLWLAREYGIPLRAGVVRYTWLTSTARGEKKRKVLWIGWGEGVLRWGPRAVRHGLITAVARRYLGAPPQAWDSLAVWSGRRTLQGRAWARSQRGRLRGIPRPDAEWWEGGAFPWAIEVDTGKRPLPQLLERVRAWRYLYRGPILVTPSWARVQVLRAEPSLWEVRIVYLPCWWESAEGVDL